MLSICMLRSILQKHFWSAWIFRGKDQILREIIQREEIIMRHIKALAIKFIVAVTVVYSILGIFEAASIMEMFWISAIDRKSVV